MTASPWALLASWDVTWPQGILLAPGVVVGVAGDLSPGYGTPSYQGQGKSDPGDCLPSWPGLPSCDCSFSGSVDDSYTRGQRLVVLLAALGASPRQTHVLTGPFWVVALREFLRIPLALGSGFAVESRTTEDVDGSVFHLIIVRYSDIH